MIPVNGSGVPCKLPGSFWAWQKTFVTWPRRSIYGEWIWLEWAYLKPSSGVGKDDTFIGWAYISLSEAAIELLKEVKHQ